MLRFPDGMRDEIKRAAERSGRSMNAEIITRLETTFPLRGGPVDLLGDRPSEHRTRVPWDMPLEVHDLYNLIDKSNRTIQECIEKLRELEIESHRKIGELDQ